MSLEDGDKCDAQSKPSTAEASVVVSIIADSSTSLRGSADLRKFADETPTVRMDGPKFPPSSDQSLLTCHASDANRGIIRFRNDYTFSAVPYSAIYSLREDGVFEVNRLVPGLLLGPTEVPKHEMGHAVV